MAGWRSGLSVTPILLITSHKGHSLDCISDAKTSGFPDFPQYFFLFTFHFSFQWRQRREERITYTRVGWKSADTRRGGDSASSSPFIHKTFSFIGRSVTSKMTNTAYRCLDVRIFFLMHTLPSKLEKRLKKCAWHLE